MSNNRIKKTNNSYNNKPFSINDEQLVKPFLKWAGGKRWLIPELQKIFSSEKLTNKRLVEPFAGGLSVSLGLMPKLALINDINPHLINLYQQIQKGFQITFTPEHAEDFFYSIREKFNLLIRNKQILNSPEAASYFYYLNKTCFNGLCRFNSKGEFNVPFGKYKKINYQSTFKEEQSIFANWQFLNSDFENLSIKDSSDIIYVDPPYDVEFTKYSAEDFKWEDQERLVVWLNKFNCPIIASNQATDRVIKLYEKNNFKIQYLSAPRRISANGNRKEAREILATKNLFS